MRRALLVLLALAAAAAAPARGAELDAALAKARELGLARDPGWEALLHVVPRALGLRRGSEIPAGKFFLSEAGPGDPAAELEATLRGLLAPGETGDRAVHCRFPARTRWLA